MSPIRIAIFTRTKVLEQHFSHCKTEIISMRVYSSVEPCALWIRRLSLHALAYFALLRVHLAVFCSVVKRDFYL